MALEAALRAARAYAPHALKLEIECKRLEQVHEALDEGADIIMLDNMRGERLQSALEIIGPGRKWKFLEAFGKRPFGMLRSPSRLDSVGALTLTRSAH